MYVTVLKPAKVKVLSIEELIVNPFLPAPEQEKTKRVTIPISEEYGKELYMKNSDKLKKQIGFLYDAVDDTAEHYRHFRIPKKTNPNKYRDIDAPDEILTQIQGIILNNLQNFWNIIPHAAAFAYVKNNSTIDAMKLHQKNKSNWYLHIDLKDFFPSITEDVLRKTLSQVYPFPYFPKEDMDTIIKYALLNGKCPQGSKLSPFLSNMVMVPVDYMIHERLKNLNKHHFVYTRYADDMTISCKENFKPKEIIDIIKNVFKELDLPFRINDEKTRYGSRAGSNYHLGVIINKDNKISIGHERNNKFRAMIYNFCQVGSEWEPSDVYKMLGIISYYKSIEPNFVKNVLEKYNKKFNTDILKKAKQMIS